MCSILVPPLNCINNCVISIELIMATFVRGDDLLKFGVKRFTYQASQAKPKQKRKIFHQYKQNKKPQTIKNARPKKSDGNNMVNIL